MKGYSFHVPRGSGVSNGLRPNSWVFTAVLRDPPLLTDPEFVTQGWNAAVPRPYPGQFEAGSLTIAFRQSEHTARVVGTIRTINQVQLQEWKRIGEKEARKRFPTAFEHWNDCNVTEHMHIKPREAYDHVKVDRARWRQYRTDGPFAAEGLTKEQIAFSIRSCINRWTRFDPNIYEAAVESARAEINWLWNLQTLTSTEVQEWEPQLIRRYEDLIYNGVPEMAILRYREMLWQTQWAGGEAYPWMYDWWMQHRSGLKPPVLQEVKPPVKRKNRFLSIGAQSNGPPAATKP